MRAAATPGSERCPALGAEPIGETKRERDLRADHGQIDALHVGRVGQTIDVRCGDGKIGGELGGTWIAWRAVEIGVRIFAAEGPAECVFSSSAADDQNPHDCFCALRKASRGSLRRALRGIRHLGRELTRLAGVVAAGGAHVVAQRPVGHLGAAADVFATHDAVVFSRRHPPLQLRRPHRMHRMGQRQRAQQLVHDVESLAGGDVFVRLLHEGLDVELAREPRAAPSSGHFHVETLGRHYVLGPERARRGRRKARTCVTTRETRVGSAAPPVRRVSEERRG